MKQILYKLFLEQTDDSKLQFFRYIFVGGFAAVVNMGSLYVFTDIIKIDYLLSNVIGFTLGLITNYILSKILVFSKENTMKKSVEFIIYAIIGVAGLGIDTLLIWFATEKIGLYYMLSKVISTAIVFVWNFGARKILYKLIDNKEEK